MGLREWILLLVIAVCGFTLHNLLRPDALKNSKDCEVKIESGRMADRWMTGVLEQGAAFEAHHGWYGCNKLSKGDLVLYRMAAGHEPVVRQVRATSGDRFRLIPAEGRTAWYIEINGTLLRVNGKPYKFGSSGTPALALYEKSHKGLLDQRSAILFSNQVPGDTDSGSLGVIAVSDILAKVVPN